MAQQYFAVFEDMVRVYVGPFDSVEQCDAHAKFCDERGDGSTYHGAVTEVPEDERDCIVSVEEDLAWKPEP